MCDVVNDVAVFGKQTNMTFLEEHRVLMKVLMQEKSYSRPIISKTGISKQTLNTLRFDLNKLIQTPSPCSVHNVVKLL